MKNKSPYIISTLTFLLTSMMSTSTFAISDELKSQSSWSIYDIMSVAEEAKEEAKEYCSTHSMFDCERQYFFERGREESIYSAISEYSSRRFVVTAINPYRQTMRVIYNSNNGYDETPEDLLNVYTARLEKNYMVDTLAISYKQDPENQQIHQLYYGFAADDDQWFPKNSEITLPVSDMTMNDDIDNVIWAYIETMSPYGYSYGSSYQYDLNACLSDYVAGTDMECRAVIHPSGYISYELHEPMPEPVTEEPNTESGDGENNAPFETENQTPEDDVESSIGPVEQPQKITLGESNTAQAQYSHVANINVAASKSQDATTQYNKASSTNLITVASQSHESMAQPLGGNLEQNITSEPETSFPWWVLIIIGAGVAVVAWWFVPIRKKKH